jgi:hypothetical protein
MSPSTLALLAPHAPALAERLDAEIAEARERLEEMLALRRLLSRCLAACNGHAPAAAPETPGFVTTEKAASPPGPRLEPPAPPSPPRNKGGRPPSEETVETRRKVLIAIGRHGPAAPKAIAERAGIEPTQKVHNVLSTCPWFENEPDGWHLSADGQSAWNALREGPHAE